MALSLAHVASPVVVIASLRVPEIFSISRRKSACRNGLLNKGTRKATSQWWEAEILVGNPEDLQGANTPPDNLEQLDRYRAALFTCFVKLLGRRQDIEDLIQEVFMRYLRRYRSDIRVRNPGGLCLKIAHDVAVDLLRKPKREMVDAEVVELPESEDAWRNVPFERLAALREAELIVANLDDEEARLAYLDKWAERSNEEIAAELGISPSVVRQRKTRLNKKLMDIRKKEG